MSELKKREDINDRDKWDLEKIYSTPELWEKEFERLKSESKSLLKFQGKMKDKNEILGYLKLNEQISRQVEKLYVYAHMKSDEDTTNQENQGRMNRIDSFMAQYASYSAYFVPEILALEDGTIEKLIEENSEFKEYSFLMKNILKEKPHILSKEKEELLAIVSDCLGAPDSIHNMLTNADMTFGKIKDEEGKEIEITEGNYSSFIKSKDRNVRKDAFKTLFKEYKKTKHSSSYKLDL